VQENIIVKFNSWLRFQRLGRFMGTTT